MKILDYDAVTGESVERDATEEEIATYNADIENARLQYEKIAEEEQAKLAAKESALAKLAALGLTEEEAQAIVGA